MSKLIEIDFDDEVGESIMQDMSNEAYHAEKSHLSSSKIKLILKNPYFFHEPPEPEEKQAYSIGSALHSLVLEPHKFDAEFAVAPVLNMRTNAGKNAFEEFKTANNGKTVLQKKEYETVKNMSEAVLENQYVKLLLKNGVAEKSFFSELHGKKVKCRPDYYREDMGLVIDLKTTDDASLDGFTKTSAKFGYYIQDPFYCDVISSSGKPVNDFIFIAVEKKKPFMVGIYKLSPLDKTLGREQYLRAFEIHDRIDDYNEPTYKDTTSGEVVQTIVLPNYVHYTK